MINRLLAGAALLAFTSISAGAQSTRAQINTSIGTSFPDNNRGQITPQAIRSFMTSFVGSVSAMFGDTAATVKNQLVIAGLTSGAVSLVAQATAGTWNFNLPTTAGTAGQVLTSGGGAGSPMTWQTPGGALIATAPLDITAGVISILTNGVTFGLIQTVPAGRIPCNNTVSTGALTSSCAMSSVGETVVSNWHAPGSPAAGNAACMQDTAGTLTDCGGKTVWGPVGALAYNDGANALQAAATPNDFGVIYGRAAGAPSSTTAGTIDQILMGTAGAPAFRNINNCTNALTYDASTHTYGCNTTAGTGTMTQVNAGQGILLTPSPIVSNGSAAIDPSVLPGFLAGYTMTWNSATVMGITAGSAVSSDHTTLMQRGVLTKTLGAWTVGNANGCLDTGAVASASWYHVFVIERTDTGVVDLLCSLSIGAPTLPTNYTKFRRIGSIQTDLSSQFRKWSQLDAEFLWDVPVNDISDSTIGSGARLEQLASVPPGLRVQALTISSFTNATQNATAYLSSPDTTDLAPALGNSGYTFYIQVGGGVSDSKPVTVRTNTTQQIRARTSQGSGSTILIKTLGWLDARGKDD